MTPYRPGDPVAVDRNPLGLYRRPTVSGTATPTGPRPVKGRT